MALQAAVGSSINRAKNLLPTLALPKRLRQGTREAFEAAIEAHLEAATALTRALDAVDGDTDLEPGDIDQDSADEPENTYTETHGGYGAGWVLDDTEPSLAHTMDLNQARAKKAVTRLHAGDDLEEQHDGREPSLGWTIAGICGGSDDREQDADREGVSV